MNGRIRILLAVTIGLSASLTALAGDVGCSTRQNGNTYRIDAWQGPVTLESITVSASGAPPVVLHTTGGKGALQKFCNVMLQDLPAPLYDQAIKALTAQ